MLSRVKFNDFLDPWKIVLLSGGEKRGSLYAVRSLKSPRWDLTACIYRLALISLPKKFVTLLLLINSIRREKWQEMSSSTQYIHCKGGNYFIYLFTSIASQVSCVCILTWNFWEILLYTRQTNSHGERNYLSLKRIKRNESRCREGGRNISISMYSGINWLEKLLHFPLMISEKKMIYFYFNS